MRFEGTYTALVTPFRDEPGQPIDWDALDALVDAQIAGGVAGLVPCGTTGESPTLSHEEHALVVERTIKRARGRVQVVAGAGSNSTREAVAMSQHAERAGVDAVMVVVPYYNKPTQEGLYRHFVAGGPQRARAGRRLQHPGPDRGGPRARDTRAHRRGGARTSWRPRRPRATSCAPRRSRRPWDRA